MCELVQVLYKRQLVVLIRNLYLWGKSLYIRGIIVICFLGIRILVFICVFVNEYKEFQRQSFIGEISSILIIIMDVEIGFYWRKQWYLR